jgi:hypothetical protein
MGRKGKKLNIDVIKLIWDIIDGLQRRKCQYEMLTKQNMLNGVKIGKIGLLMNTGGNGSLVMKVKLLLDRTTTYMYGEKVMKGTMHSHVGASSA